MKSTPKMFCFLAPWHSGLHIGFIMNSIKSLQKLISIIHEGNTKQISTMTVTLYLIKLIDVRKNTN